MAELKTKEQMVDAIARVFEHNKKVDTLFTTPDGNCFIAKHFADFHSSRNKGMKVTTVERSAFEKENPTAEKTADEEIKYEAMTVDALKAELTKREIAFGEKDKKAVLVALLVADDDAKKK